MPLRLKVFFIAFCVAAATVLAAIGGVGYWQGQADANAHANAVIRTLHAQMKQLNETGRLAEAVQIGEYLASHDVLDAADAAWIGETRARLAAPPPPERPPASTPVPEPVQYPHALWDQALAARARGEWNLVINHLMALRAEDGKFVNEPYLDLMEDAHIQWARTLVLGNEGEKGRVMLQKALALRQSARVQAELEAADHLINATSAWRVDWASALTALLQVYRYDPFYGDVRDRLIEGVQRYQARTAVRGDYCEAFLNLSSGSLETLLVEFDLTHITDDLRRQCRAATS